MRYEIKIPKRIIQKFKRVNHLSDVKSGDRVRGMMQEVIKDVRLLHLWIDRTARLCRFGEIQKRQMYKIEIELTSYEIKVLDAYMENMGVNQSRMMGIFVEACENILDTHITYWEAIKNEEVSSENKQERIAA